MFVKDTKILDNTNNLIDISTVYPELLIKGYDFTTQTLIPVKINNLIVGNISSYIKITINDIIIKCRPETIFYTNEGWAAYNTITTNSKYKPIATVKLTENSKLLNTNNQYIKIDTIEEIEENISVLGLDTEDTNDTFIVENFVVHNLSIGDYLGGATYLADIYNYTQNTINFNLPYIQLDSFEWYFNMSNGTRMNPPITPTVTNDGFSYPAFTYTVRRKSGEPSISNAEYIASGQV